MKKHSLENSDSTNGEMFNEVKNREIKWLSHCQQVRPFYFLMLYTRIHIVLFGLGSKMCNNILYTTAFFKKFFQRIINKFSYRVLF